MSACASTRAHATRLARAASALALVLGSASASPDVGSVLTEAPAAAADSSQPSLRVLPEDGEASAPPAVAPVPDLPPISPEAYDKEKMVCKKYANGEAKIALCELDIDEYMSMVRAVCGVFSSHVSVPPADSHVPRAIPHTRHFAQLFP